MLESLITQKRKQKDILVMTHLVLGYPSFAASLELIDAMAEAGVDLIELQIPFSEPIADGPIILKANQSALQRGATVERCFEVAESAVKRHSVPMLFMTYYNIAYVYGVPTFVERMREIGLYGSIIPDLPPEEGADYLAAMSDAHLAPIFIYTPNTPDLRLREIAAHTKGFVYCVARKGVTGAQTRISADLAAYLARCRKATKLPLAVGFGLRGREDVEFLRGKADIAVVGSETLRLLDSSGVEAVSNFVRGLSAAV